MSIARKNYETNQHPFLGHNRYFTAEIDNPNASGEYTLEQGKLLARDASTGKLVIHSSSNSQPGGKLPVGVAGAERTIPDGGTIEVNVCESGHVLEKAVKLDGSDTLDTQVTIQDGSSGNTQYSKTIRDLIASETVGIVLIQREELSEFDNQ